MRAAFLIAAIALVYTSSVACQDTYSSNAERNTHMGDMRAAALPPPEPPPAAATPAPPAAAVTAPPPASVAASVSARAPAPRPPVAH